MSKEEGRKIGIKFTEQIHPVVAEPTFVVDPDYSTPVGIATGSSRYSTDYDYSRAFDRSTSTQWYTRTTGMQWIMIEMYNPSVTVGFRVYSGSSYRPNEIDLYGSHDGIDFDLIIQTQNDNTTGWHEHTFEATEKYKFYKWEVVSRHSTYLYVYELQLLFADTYDKSGEEEAFTISGQEYQWLSGPDGNGPLIEKEYKVKTVEGYPIPILWEMTEDLTLDGSEFNVIDTKCYEVSSGVSLTGTVYANEGDIVLATITHRSSFTVPDGWEKLAEISCPEYNQSMVFVTKKVDLTGNHSFTATQSSAGRIYLNLISVEGVGDFHYYEGFEVLTPADGGKPISVPDKQQGEIVIWGASAPLWASSAPYGSWVTSPDDLQLVSLDQAITQPRQANFIDDGSGQTSERTFTPSPNSTGDESVVAAVRAGLFYDTEKVYVTEQIVVFGEKRIVWEEETPTGTDVLVEYSTEENEWVPINNGEIINIDGGVWLKVTLNTSDISVTPIIKRLRIEELDAPDDALLITLFDEFRNIQSDVTVKYDQTLGNLSGRGGKVVSFEETFSPLELKEGKTSTGISVGEHERFSIVPNAIVDLMLVAYEYRFADESFTVDVSCTIDFVYTGGIDP